MCIRDRHRGLVNENSLSQASKDIHKIWFNTLSNAMKGRDLGIGVRRLEISKWAWILIVCRKEKCGRSMVFSRSVGGRRIHSKGQAVQLLHGFSIDKKGLFYCNTIILYDIDEL